jgi:hypothetical protein
MRRTQQNRPGKMMASIVIPHEHQCVAPNALALMPPSFERDLRRLTREFGLNLEFSSTAEIATARIEASCPELVLVDCDLLGRVEDLFRFARSLRPDVWLIGVTYYWSEREENLRGLADGLIHKPPRGDEWRRAVLASGLSTLQRQVSTRRPRPLGER